MSFTSATNSAAVAATLQARVMGEQGVVTASPQRHDDYLRALALQDEIRRLTAVVEALDRKVDAFGGKLDSVVERNEVDEARRQNALIRSGAPVPAFKEHAAATTTPTASAPASRLPFLFGGHLTPSSLHSQR
jgi:hypothetical protein